MAYSSDETAISGSKMLIVSEYLSDKDERGPLTSPVGHVFRSWMRDVNINPDEVAYASVLRGPSLSDALTRDKSLARKGVRSVQTGKYLRAEFHSHVDALHAVVRKHSPNVVVALGDLALWALTKEKSLKFARGRITEGIEQINSHKVLPTFSPMQVMGEYANRPILLADLAKAKRESFFPELRRPQRFLHLRPTIPDLQQFYNEFIRPASAVSVDIETKGSMITCVGFAPSKDRALVVPFFDAESPSGNYWKTKQEEHLAWAFVRMVLREKPSFGQNFQYDMQYLWREMGIPCPKFCDDTMLLHHALQPEMQKGLGFLASIYTDELAWKFMHKVSAADREAKKGDIE